MTAIRNCIGSMVSKVVQEPSCVPKFMLAQAIQLPSLFRASIAPIAVCEVASFLALRSCRPSSIDNSPRARAVLNAALHALVFFALSLSRHRVPLRVAFSVTALSCLVNYLKCSTEKKIISDTEYRERQAITKEFFDSFFSLKNQEQLKLIEIKERKIESSKKKLDFLVREETTLRTGIQTHLLEALLPIRRKFQQTFLRERPPTSFEGRKKAHIEAYLRLQIACSKDRIKMDLATYDPSQTPVPNKSKETESSLNFRKGNSIFDVARKETISSAIGTVTTEVIAPGDRCLCRLNLRTKEAQEEYEEERIATSHPKHVHCLDLNVLSLRSTPSPDFHSLVEKLVSVKDCPEKQSAIHILVGNSDIEYGNGLSSFSKESCNPGDIIWQTLKHHNKFLDEALIAGFNTFHPPLDNKETIPLMLQEPKQSDEGPLMLQERKQSNEDVTNVIIQHEKGLEWLLSNEGTNIQIPHFFLPKKDCPSVHMYFLPEFYSSKDLQAAKLIESQLGKTQGDKYVKTRREITYNAAYIGLATVLQSAIELAKKENKPVIVHLSPPGMQSGYSLPKKGSLESNFQDGWDALYKALFFYGPQLQEHNVEVRVIILTPSNEQEEKDYENLKQIIGLFLNEQGPDSLS